MGLGLAYYSILAGIMVVSLLVAWIPWRPPALRALMAAVHIVASIVVIIVYLSAPIGGGTWPVFVPGAVASLIRLVRLAIRHTWNSEMRTRR